MGDRYTVECCDYMHIHEEIVEKVRTEMPGEDTLYDLNNVSYNGEATATRTESGTSYMGLSANSFVNLDENFDATFDVTDGYITILPIKISVTITGTTASDPYDGQEHSVPAPGYAASSDSNLFDSDKLVFTGTAQAARTDVGTTMMGLSEEDFSYNDNNVSAEFTVTDGFQTITPITAEVTIVGNWDSSDYDGAAHTITGYTATAEPALYDVDSDIVFTGTASASQTDVGTAVMGLEAGQFSNRNANFSKVTFTIEADGYQTITPITATVTVVGNNQSFDYDGESHEVTGYTATADTPLYDVARDIEFHGRASATRTNAGVTAMNLADSQFENKNVEKLVYVKDGADEPHEIDALSGSTVTTNAVVNGVNAGLLANQIVMEGGAS